MEINRKRISFISENFYTGGKVIIQKSKWVFLWSIYSQSPEIDGTLNSYKGFATHI